MAFVCAFPLNPVRPLKQAKFMLQSMIVKHKHKETTNSSHGGGSDHFSSGFLGLPDLVVLVIKILKHRGH